MLEPLTMRQAAAELGISHHTVAAWVRKRLLPHFRIGRRVVLDGAELAAWLEGRRVAIVPKAARPYGGDAKAPDR
jgi:excisionase family DNA binding protein